jgi:hypothetical protein
LEKQKIVLIVVILILIGVVMGLSGYILGLNQQPKVNNSTTNNTTATNNSTVTNNTTTSAPTEETNYIGKAAAKQKAIDFLTEYGVMQTSEIRSIDFVTINGVPLYRIKYWDNYVMANGAQHGWGEVLIGAKDGRLYDEYGETVKT